MNTRDLLVELGTEELPPKALLTLSTAFADNLGAGLDKAGLAHGAIKPFATPRRLALIVEALAGQQPEQVSTRRGPALTAAFDAEGKATPAALGFAKSCGVSIETLGREETAQGQWLSFQKHTPGRPTVELVPALVSEALSRLPTPKRMRWGASDTEFVRPVHWLVLLFGSDVVEGGVLGLHAGRHTRGHRFHASAPIELTSPADYAARLEREGHVIADFGARRARIRAAIEARAQEAGGAAIIPDALLDEVTALCEWPLALTGRFEERYLAVPQEALISTMEGNQRYFPLLDAGGKLMARFVVISNLESRDPAQVIAGNERVIRPRFSDAEFFFTQDCKEPLAARRAALAKVVFQHKLGTLAEKGVRIAQLARDIGQRIGADGVRCARAAELAKCDLLTQMVGEFPELQGVMGRHYALHDGEDTEVAQAIEEHYRPRFAGDQLPATPAGQALALADRLDTLAGIFAIGQKPTGDKDPFALRRAALGVLRILIEGRLDLDLFELIGAAITALPERLRSATLADEVFDFVSERLRAYTQETGARPDEFEAVAATRPTRPLDFMARLDAVRRFRALPEAEALTAANKRIRNILKQVNGEVPTTVDNAQLTEDAEHTLAAQLAAQTREVTPLFERGDYTAALTHLAALRAPVDHFFDKVMVMAEDRAQRDNRLALLNALSTLFLRTADLSRLQQG
jgi:glycyl-tRNA synthetase beta chain